MPYDYALMKKRAMQAQDAKMQTSTHAPTQQVPGSGFVSEVSALNATQKSEVKSFDNHNRRRRNRHRLAQAMAVHASSTLR